MHSQTSPFKVVKALLPLFIGLLLSLQSAFGQQAFPQPRYFKLSPGSVTPGQAGHRSHSITNQSGMKALGDTTDVLDYSTYSEVMAQNLQISYMGSWNSTPMQIAGQELTSFIDGNSFEQQKFSFAQVAFDSLAFASYANMSVYSLPRAGSTVFLDSLGLFIGISGDTVQGDGTMANDSLVLSIYSVVGNTVSANPVKVIVNSGYAGLQPFITGTTPGTLRYVSLGVGQAFNQGESFAVRVNYLNKDTSSHCFLSYSYADSCQQIIYQGQTYSSPAYPSPFAGSSIGGSIDSISGSQVKVDTITNQFIYNLAGIPANCSYVYFQNWEILAMVSVNVPYSTQIQASQTTACGGQTVNLNAGVLGTDSPTITYSWAASTGGVLTGANTATPVLTVPANVVDNITVTLTVNNGAGNVSDSLVIINCHLKISAGYTATVCTNSTAPLAPVVSGGTPPYTFLWSATGGSIGCNNCIPTFGSITQNSVYTITVTDSVGATATASYSFNVNGIISGVGVSVSNSGIACSSQPDVTTATASGGTSPYQFNWGDGNITTGNPVQTHSYYYPGGAEVISVSDSNNCSYTYFDTIISHQPVINLVQAVQPACPNAANGEIIISVSGGTAPYAYNWANYSNSDTLSNASQAHYTVTVTDVNGCTAAFGYTLYAVSDYAFSVFVSTTGANCSQPGSVTTTVNGGIPPYSYFWSDSAVTPNIQTSVSNEYDVTVTDSAGCQAFGYSYLQTTCQSLINGIAFYDSAGTCSPTGNAPISDLIVMATSSTGDAFYGYADNNGNFSVQVNDTGTYTLSALNYYSSACGNFTFCGNSTQTVYLPVIGTVSNNNNIGLVPSSGFNLGIHPGWTTADPGFTKQYWVFYYNSSPIPYVGPATITFNYDSNLTYLYTDETPAPNVDSIHHTLTWSVDSVPNLNNGYWLQLDGYFQVPSTLSLNYLLQSSFTITPVTGDCDVSDNHYSYYETVVGSHDPNEKTVSPSGPVTADDSVLTYTIHFQNTGTDSTHFIVIKDTLSPNLDPATVRNIASSDKYSAFNISGTGILTWTFNPLRVVDSATNPSASKRFIMFTVHKKHNLPIGTTINNTAYVYFDYNTAVVTNTVRDTEALPNNIFEVNSSNGINVKAFPNPFNDVTHIVVTGINEKFGFELYDVTGRLQQTIPSIENSQFEVHKGQLANGVYLYRILVTGKPAAYGKLVVE